MVHDWTHGNSLFLTGDQDAYLMSIRNQNLVAQFDRETGALQWALGEDDPASSGDDTWPWLSVPEGTRLPNQQHGCILTPGGTLMLYDNGNDVEQSLAPSTSWTRPPRVPSWSGVGRTRPRTRPALPKWRVCGAGTGESGVVDPLSNSGCGVRGTRQVVYPFADGSTGGGKKH